MTGYDVEAVRKDFPILDRQVHDGRKLVYLDNAATSQKPRQVLDALSGYYERYNANVHRGVHVLAEEATALYEGARDKVAAFINAPSRDEVIFTKNASESLNLVANMLGTVNPIGDIARRAHDVGAIVVVDASQAAPQLPIDLAAMTDEERPDLLAFTGHKAVGPTGIGVLWGRRSVLDQLPPFLGGGEMIETVTMERSTYAPIPHKFEAGTPPIVEAVGLGAAVDYLSVLGMDHVHRHEQAITAYALEGLQTVPGLTVLGPLDVRERGGAISFEIAGVHPHDVATVLDTRGIAVRAGHHCAKPAHQRFGVQSSTRMSSYLYTTPAEIDALVEGLEYTRRYFRLD